MDFLADVLKVIVGIVLFLLLLLGLLWWLNPDAVRNHPWYQRASETIREERGLPPKEEAEEGSEDSQDSQDQESEEGEETENGEDESEDQNGQVGEGPNREEAEQPENDTDDQLPNQQPQPAPEQPEVEFRELTPQERIDKLTRPLPAARASDQQINQVYFFSFKVNSSDFWIARINRTNKELNGFYLNQQNNQYYNLKGEVYQDNSWFLEEFDARNNNEKIARFKVSTSQISANRINLNGHRFDLKNDRLQSISGLQIDSMPELSSSDFSFNKIKIEVEEIQESQENIEINIKHPKLSGFSNQNLQNQVNRDIVAIANSQRAKQDLIQARNERREGCEQQNITNCELEYRYDLNYKINYNRNNLLSILFIERTSLAQSPMPVVRYYGLNYDLRNHRKLPDSIFFEGQNWERQLITLTNGKITQNLVYNKSRVGGVSFNSHGLQVIVSPSFFEKNKLLIPVAWSEIDFLNPAFFNQSSSK